jgi:hypothetical protein
MNMFDFFSSRRNPQVSNDSREKQQQAPQVEDDSREKQQQCPQVGDTLREKEQDQQHGRDDAEGEQPKIPKTPAHMEPIFRYTNNPVEYARALHTMGPMLDSSYDNSALLCSKLQYLPIKLGCKSCRYPGSISSIRFDSIGSLFTATSREGKLLIYDFDEILRCLPRMPTESGLTPLRVYPIIELERHREIADLSWSIYSPDEIAVVYKNDYKIEVFNLNGSCRANRLAGEFPDKSGNSCIIYIPDAKFEAQKEQRDRTGKESWISVGEKRSVDGQNALSKPLNRFVVGCNSGYVRCWDYPKRGGRPTWEVLPNKMKAHDSVVSLQIHPAQKNILLALTRSGIFTQFDLLISQNGFVARSPACICRIDCTTLFPNSSSFRSMTVPVEQPNVLFITDEENGVCHSSLEVPWQVQGQVQAEPIMMKSPSLLGGRRRRLIQSLYSTGGIPSENGPLPTLGACKASGAPVFPSWARGMQMFIPGNRKSIGDLLDCGQLYAFSISPHTQAQAALKRDSNPLSTLPAYPSSVTDTRAPAPDLFRISKDYTMVLTLPGMVHEATAGEKVVLLSTNLSEYLTTSTAEKGFPSKSASVGFDWSEPVRTYFNENRDEDDGEENNDDDVLNVGKNLSVNGSLGRIAKIELSSRYAIILEEPYSGPDVRAGEPAVRLRTNLFSIGSKNRYPDTKSYGNVTGEENGHPNVQGVQPPGGSGSRPGKSAQAKNSGYSCVSSTCKYDYMPKLGAYKLQYEYKLPAFMTALAAHPEHPFLVAGHFDGTIEILGAMSPCERRADPHAVIKDYTEMLRGAPASAYHAPSTHWDYSNDDDDDDDDSDGNAPDCSDDDNDDDGNHDGYPPGCSYGR